MLGRAWEPSAVLVLSCSLCISVGAVSPAGRLSASAEVLPNGAAIPHAPRWEVQKKPLAVRRYRSSVVRRQAPPSAKIMSPEVDIPRVSASLLEPEEHWHADEPEHVDGELPGAPPAPPLPPVTVTTPANGNVESVTSAPAAAESVTLVPMAHTADVTVKPIFNCEDGLSDWEFGWRKAKKEWCCAHENRGCPPTSESTPHNATAVEPCTTAECQGMANGVHADGSGTHHMTGQEVCEGNNFTQYACLDFGHCCAFDENKGLCYSKIGSQPCVLAASHAPAPPPAAPVHPLEEPPAYHEPSHYHYHEGEGPPGWSGMPMPPHGPPPEQLAGEHGKAPWVSVQYWWGPLTAHEGPVDTSHGEEVHHGYSEEVHHGYGEEVHHGYGEEVHHGYGEEVHHGYGEDSYGGGTEEEKTVGHHEGENHEGEHHEGEHHEEGEHHYGEDHAEGEHHYGEDHEDGEHYHHSGHEEGEATEGDHGEEEHGEHGEHDEHGDHPAVSSVHPLLGPPIPKKNTSSKVAAAISAKKGVVETNTEEKKEGDSKSAKRTILIVIGSLMGVTFIAGIAYVIYAKMAKASPEGAQQESESLAEAHPNASEDQPPPDDQAGGGNPRASLGF